ncbi:purine nucleoside phosphorylase [Monocercomonoides exilis]|uniref:purine nucleoside phosphorylase n=1 Tax=Monocercomonoides exilis TaxID=2049356 RepID=UPI00355977A2|nr:purine nucleoside phosphorylase [Monocercomonoides exilis]|eukprot:MONOS_728.1-p1 / transcript=MONOS_728.1 / gene=MONOS_728 / organism=Monocercomonoides_exilis_PA203 / gene_product=purine nucleoside phosphorylase [EC:2.4.2.1] / transcript_product=purine nucleoside phosphorylase [EC:2.4.2.1] / location=Mono_scaffold00012:121300-122274(+) / protein_length=284 / sequence_SO=supercontig / SO=protein_coding / is_pseudo=false
MCTEIPTVEQIQETAKYIREKVGDFSPIVGMQLGTGSNEMGDHLDASPKPIIIPYSEIPHFPTCTVPGHSGELICGYVSGVPTICLKGRFHFYEGHTMQRATYPIRVLAMLGVKTLILTNAAGCLQKTWTLGDIVVLTDHLNFMGTNPLIGPNVDLFPPFSTRFPDMSNCYDASLRELAKKKGEELGLKLREGVYFAYSGPSFETGAEIHMMRVIGADCVGMSTVPEVIVARHCGMKCLAFSIMTDIAEADAHPCHEEIVEVGHKSSDSLINLLRHIIPKMVG